MISTIIITQFTDDRWHVKADQWILLYSMVMVQDISLNDFTVPDGDEDDDEDDVSDLYLVSI